MFQKCSYPKCSRALCVSAQMDANKEAAETTVQLRNNGFRELNGRSESWKRSKSKSKHWIRIFRKKMWILDIKEYLGEWVEGGGSLWHFWHRIGNLRGRICCRLWIFFRSRASNRLGGKGFSFNHQSDWWNPLCYMFWFPHSPHLISQLNWL